MNFRLNSLLNVSKISKRTLKVHLVDYLKIDLIRTLMKKSKFLQIVNRLRSFGI